MSQIVSFQHAINIKITNKNFYIFFSYQVFEIWHVVYTDSSSEFELA